MCGASRETAATCVDIKIFRRPTPSTRHHLTPYLISTQVANVDAAITIKIGARDAAGVLARTGLAHVLGRAELDFLGAA